MSWRRLSVVASGEYVGESKISRRFSSMNPRDRALDDWLRQQALPAYDAYRAVPSRGMSMDEVRASIGKRDV
jgi:hypothetical protein